MTPPRRVSLPVADPHRRPLACPVSGTWMKIFSGRVNWTPSTRGPPLTCCVPTARSSSGGQARWPEDSLW